MVLKPQMLGNEVNVMLAAIPVALNANSRDDCHSTWYQNLGKCNFDFLIRLANHHGLIPWLAMALDSKNIDLMELSEESAIDGFLSRLHSLMQIYRFNSEAQMRNAVELSMQLSNKGVPHVVFKGSALMRQVYPSFLQSRVSDDLDVLVAAESMSDSLAVLERMGYVAKANASKLTQFIAKYSKWYRGRDLVLARDSGLRDLVDLHWKIADEFSFSIDTSRLLKNTVGITTNYGEIQSLPPHRHFVYLCSHGYSDYYFRLRYLVDVYLSMKHESFDEKQVFEFAKQCGVLEQVERSMQLARCFFSINEESAHTDAYVQTIMRRLADSNGLTVRKHPNKGNWTWSDKNKHLLTQIKNRSAKAYWFSPVVARTKLTYSDVEEWRDSETQIIWFYLGRLVKKLF